MLRTRIALLVIVLLSSVLILAAGLIWGTLKAEYYFQRSQLAHTALESYLRLSQDVYRHFKEQLDIVIKGLDPLNAESEQSLDQLQRTLTEVKAVTRQEIAHVGRADYTDEVTEIEQVAEMEAIIAEGLRAFARIHRLHGQGNEQDAHQHLRQLLDVLIDKRLRPLIDKAVAGERAEVTLAEQQAAVTIERLRIVAAGVGGLAVGFAFIVGLLLLRRLHRPLATLMHGTRKIASGDLEHRIELAGRDELARLATHINDMTRDLDQQRDQLIQARSDLEKKVASRTMELLEANDKLLRVDELRRQFFADVSHELRTPLTIIRGEAEVTLRGRAKEIEEYRAALSRIVDLTGQVSKLVDDLLFLARSGTEGARFNPGPVEMTGLITDAWEDATVLAQRGRLEVTLALPVSRVWVHGDRMRLKQMLHILIDNAVRYSKNAGVIDLSLEAEGDWVIFRIADHGIGMAEAELGLVFGRFFRGQAARRVAPGGTGLGLPLAKAIVDAHQGVINIASQESQGTTVTVRLLRCANEDPNNDLID